MGIQGLLVNGTIKGKLSAGKTLKGSLTGSKTLKGLLTYGKRSVEIYKGAYEVTPKPWEETVLPTQDKLLTGDVTVFEIPYAEVSNVQGGYTVTIGG